MGLNFARAIKGFMDRVEKNGLIFIIQCGKQHMVYDSFLASSVETKG